MLFAIITIYLGLKLNYNNIATGFSSNRTLSTLENRFYYVKRDAKLINDFIKKGINLITLSISNIDGKAIVRSVNRGFVIAIIVIVLRIVDLTLTILYLK